MKTILRLILFLAAACIASFAISGELEKAETLYQQGKYKEALSIYMKPAYRNMVGVQVRVGNIYLESAVRDEKKSTEWFQKAADQGDSKGIYNLALAYEEGIGVKQDFTKAFTLLKQAADMNLPSAMNEIGLMYRNGWGVKKDEKEAALWYLKAANAGSTNGMCNSAGVMMYSKIVETDYKQAHEMLDACIKAEPTNSCCLVRMSELYADGWGVPENRRKAHELRQKAAAQGNNGIAMYMVARDLDYGIGVDKDAKEAMSWYEKAAAKDHAKSMYRLYEVYEYGKLGQAVDKAKANEWKARAEKTMKEQGLSRNEWVDDFRLKMEEADKDKR